MNLLTENCAIQVKSKHFMAFLFRYITKDVTVGRKSTWKTEWGNVKNRYAFLSIKTFSPFTVLNYPVKS